MFTTGFTLAVTFAIILIAMFLLWILSVVRHNAAIVDPFWGAGFALVAWAAFLMHWPSAPRTTLLCVLTTVWGLRLSLFLLWRNWGTTEDRRYAAMRSHHGANFWWISLFTVFLLQAFLLWFISLPVQIAICSNRASPLGVLDALGLCFWIVGMFFETTADWQLARFKRDPQNASKVLDRGVWRYSRHPNYFGDFCVWWGIYLIAAAGGAWSTLLSPLVMSILLMKVSGVPLLESTVVDRRPEYADYQSRTNAFFPGPPK